jgi:hypothetical protein
MTLGFVNADLQEQLIRILNSTPIKYTRNSDGTVTVSGFHEEAFDAAIDLVRQLRFPFWHNFRPSDPARYPDYIAYMRQHRIDFEEEVQGDENRQQWILVKSGTSHYDWGIEPFTRP